MTASGQPGAQTAKRPGVVADSDLACISQLAPTVPNEEIAWKSVAGSAIGHAGVVRFEPTSDSATRVTIRLSYNPPAGVAGHGVARLFGADPKRQGRRRHGAAEDYDRNRHAAPAGAEPDFEPFKPWIRRVLQTLLPEDRLPLVNVNFPREPRGLVWTDVSVRQYDGKVVPTTDPLGRELFWFTVTSIQDVEEGSDRWAVERGWISLTPLRLDVTDEALLAEVRTRHPMDEALAAAVSPITASAEAVQAVRDDEAAPAIAETVSGRWKRRRSH